MKHYLVSIEPRALEDIQDIIFYYDSQTIGLGEKFFDELESSSMHSKSLLIFKYATTMSGACH